MNKIGIICEYNPFHNGHIYHINKIKELYPDSMIILVLSGNFTERGIPSIIDKWDKTEISLNHGIDLVVELPFPFATQSADIFAKGAIAILKELKVDYLIFGSENNDINNLINLANISNDNINYQKKVKEYLNNGINYPTALSKAFGDFSKDNITTPNDLLGLSYVKEILKQKANIKPLTIKRTNNYHSNHITDKISSATGIRNDLIRGKSIKKAVPKDVYKVLKKKLFTQNDYLPYLKYKIDTTDDLSIFQTVDEGIENRIKKFIHEVKTWDELVTKIKTKRYTYNKINRMLIHILCDFTKEKAKQFINITYIRVLGFNEIGKLYLNKIKKDINIPIITTFSKSDDEMLKFEMKTTCVYASILTEDKKNELIKQEYQNKPKMKG